MFIFVQNHTPEVNLGHFTGELPLSNRQTALNYLLIFKILSICCPLKPFSYHNPCKLWPYSNPSVPLYPVYAYFLCINRSVPLLFHPPTSINANNPGSGMTVFQISLAPPLLHFFLFTFHPLVCHSHSLFLRPEHCFVQTISISPDLYIAASTSLTDASIHKYQSKSSGCKIDPLE